MKTISFVISIVLAGTSLALALPPVILMRVPPRPYVAVRIYPPPIYRVPIYVAPHYPVYVTARPIGPPRIIAAAPPPPPAMVMAPPPPAPVTTLVSCVPSDDGTTVTVVMDTAGQRTTWVITLTRKIEKHRNGIVEEIKGLLNGRPVKIKVDRHGIVGDIKFD